MRIIFSALASMVLAAAIGCDKQPVATESPVKPPAATVVPEYPGFLAEMRQADLVVLVKGWEVVPSKERDPKTGWIMTEQVTGTIEEVYKGDAKKGETIEFTIPRAEQNLRVAIELFNVGHAFFAAGPSPSNEPLVYLLKGKENQVLNIARPQPVITEYVRLAALKTDAEAAVELVRLYTHMQMHEQELYYYTAAYVVAYDVKRHYPHLDIQGKAFAKLLDDYRPRIFKAVADSRDPLLQAMWLGSFLPEADRKNLVASLLPIYEANDKRLKELEKQPQPPHVEPPPGAGCPDYPPLDAARDRARHLVTGMALLMDTSWHDRIAKITTIGSTIPWDSFPDTPKFTEETLAKAKAFIK
jgi:hypothetical protein